MSDQQDLIQNEAIARAKLEKLAAMVQAQHMLDRDDPLKYSYDQMTVLFDRLDAAREAHDAAYAAYWEALMNGDNK